MTTSRLRPSGPNTRTGPGRGQRRLGAQMPRVRTAPVYAFTSGGDAVDLAASAGLTCDPWQCTFLDDALGETADGLWSAGEVSLWVPRQNGKGTLIEVRVLYGLFVLREKLIIWSAHQYRTAAEGFKRIKDLIRNTPALHKQVRRYIETNGEQGIVLKTGERLQFVARSRAAARGFTGDLVILDEAQFITEAQMAALMPTLSSRPNPQIWYCGTPPDDPAAWVYELRKGGEAGQEGLVHYDWGLDLDITDPDDVARLDDVDLWYAANPSMGIRLTEAFCVKERKRLKLSFAAERLGVWLPRAEDANRVISETAWSALADEPEYTPNVVIGVDTNIDRTRTAIVMVGRREDGLIQLSMADYRPGTQWVLPRLLELIEEHDPIAVAVDVKRAAGSLMAGLEHAGITVPADPEEPERGDLAVPTVTEVGQAYGMFVDAVLGDRDPDAAPEEAQRHPPTIRHLDEEPLTEAVAGADVRPLSGATAWAHAGSADIAPLVAATNAHWALVIREPLVTDDYDVLASVG